MAELINLVRQGTDKPVALACGLCGTVYALSDSARAGQCCMPYHCDTCGAETKRYRTRCTDCIRAKNRDREAQRREAATVVAPDEVVGAMLYDADDDRWFQDFDDACDLDDDAPPYVYATTPKPLRLDAESIMDSALEDHHEGAADYLDPRDVELLQAILDAWCERTDIVSYEPDFSRVVVIHRHPSAGRRQP